MTQTYRNKTGRALARTCWFTALLNGVFAVQGEESLPQPPASPTNPSTPSNPLLPGNPADDGYGKWSPSPLKYGSVDAHLSLFTGAMYDDNIHTTEFDEESDYILSISPRLSLGMGDYRVREGSLLTLEYTPSFVFYTQNSDLDSVSHAASAAGQITTGPWQFNLSQGYLHLFDTELDVGTLVGRDIYTTLGSVQYEISPKTSLEFNGRQSINDFKDDVNGDSPNSYNEWMIEAFADYLYTPKVRIGLGLSTGWFDNRASVNSTYQQLLARVSYAVTEKVDLTARAGGQLQEFEEVQGTSQDNRINGIFSVGVGYRPVEKTALSLSAYRSDHSSVSLYNQGYTTTGLDVTLRQALTDRLSAGISGGYSLSDYYSTTAGSSADRQDRYWRAQVNLDWRVLEQLSVGIFYQYRNDDSSGSTSSTFSFSNNQVGINAAYRF